MYALFRTSPGDRVTYTINPSSHCNSNHLSYFKFVGWIIAKAIYDNKLLECYFTRSFYKHILGVAVKYTDMESEDYSFYQGLVFLLENNVKDLGYDLTFSTEVGVWHGHLTNYAILFCLCILFVYPHTICLSLYNTLYAYPYTMHIYLSLYNTLYANPYTIHYMHIFYNTLCAYPYIIHYMPILIQYTICISFTIHYMPILI